MPQTFVAIDFETADQGRDIYPTKLPDVCRALRIPLKHHDAESDAEACARIVIQAHQDGHRELLSRASPTTRSRRATASPNGD